MGIVRSTKVSDTVQVYTRDGDKLFQFGSKGRGDGQLKAPSGICTDSSGNIFVSNMKNNRIDMFTSRGDFVRTVVRTESPCGLALNVLNGNIAVVTKGNTIFVFLPDGSVYNRFQLVGGVDVSFVTFNNEGNILFTDAMRNTVHEYTRDGDKLFQFGSKGRGEGQLRSPARICTDSSGNIFVSNVRNKRFDMFTSRGEFVRTVFSTKSPVGLACGPDGQLVVTDARSHTVTIIPRQLVLSG
uniref:SMP-30/Gluconolactonase/LRE-like region domain-containing protein n=1 Tax=Branchiostoma floridae TaxID=7739 RepID=C3YZL0_BRAFL|eukprot:XP_002598269.1 hypothetical protein BRAFLDRAFT_204561 [Branchiostoma floridae]